ncbi:MAG: septal ring lytic transglycosylase RlpA family protein [Patescibacteria group bacterium]
MRQNHHKMFFFSATLAVILFLASFLIFDRSAKAEFFSVEGTPFASSTADFVLSSPDDSISLTIAKDATSTPATAKLSAIANKDQISYSFTYNEQMDPVSDLFVAEVSPIDNFSVSSTVVRISLNESSRQQQVYYYDEQDSIFKKIAGAKYESSSTISFNLINAKMMFALFEPENQVGAASWYVHPRYRNDLIAASVDYPMNTKLKVVNMANGKEVMVTVKDYGPDKRVHPDRVIDLSKVAFKKLAPTSAGVIKVKVIPIN